MIPRKFEPFLVGFILSGLMSLVVSGISAVRVIGPGPGFAGVWIDSWLMAWLFAFPVVLLAAPVARRAVQGLLKGEG